MSIKNDHLGWIGNIFFILGSTLIASRNPIWGQSSNILANVLYIYVGYKTKLPSLAILSFVLAVINLCGVFVWL